MEEVSRLFKAAIVSHPRSFSPTITTLRHASNRSASAPKRFLSVRPASSTSSTRPLDRTEEKAFRVLIVDDEQISEFYVTLLQMPAWKPWRQRSDEALGPLSNFRPELVHGPIYAQDRWPRARCHYPAGGCLPHNSDCFSQPKAIRINSLS